MRTTTTCMVALVLAGCGASAAPEARTAVVAPAVRANDATGMEGVTRAEPDVEPWWTATAEAEEIQANLPNAPWSAQRVSASEVPPALVNAWRRAENRSWCAPLAPVGIEGARTRAARFDGGWAVEFDKRGLPGMTARGRNCTRCGRGAFGIAGTAVMVDDEDPGEAEEMTLRDGSRVRIEVSENEEGEPTDANGVVATLKIRGQDCVYQVWSFSGDEHLQELIRELRFVDAR